MRHVTQSVAAHALTSREAGIGGIESGTRQDTRRAKKGEKLGHVGSAGGESH